jgi:hypothetical protein
MKDKIYLCFILDDGQSSSEPIQCNDKIDCWSETDSRISPL